MKTTDYGKRQLWTLLLLTLSWRLCAQSTNGTKQSDSLATATDYIGNAKKIEIDLIKGDAAIKREVVYVSQIDQQKTTIQQQTGTIEAYKAKNGALTGQLTKANQDLGEQVLKTKQARLEIWAMRLAVALYVAGKLKGILP